ncbi:hypothetical protein U91I_03142 [alpha proteobacterium U9-1i]|nr:hypothetical protein U91I_03142 [alpha proteobacterium U9-1i]
MERVVTINLNGNPYQLDESAYGALRAYLEGAERALADNPDKAEIQRDLEQAIAEKCAAYLSAHKTVVAQAEMTRILGEMGPVGDGDSDTASGASERADAGERPTRRLYRIAEGSNIAGVCTGIAAFFDLDVNIIRILFVLSAIFTGGGTILLYIAMMFLIPSAQTSEQWAAAHGAPFNAQEVIDRAKREYGKFSSEAARNWRKEERVWRRSMKDQARQWRHSWGGFEPPPSAPAQPVGYATRVFAGLLAFVLSIVTAALLIGFLIAFFSLLTTGALIGWAPPLDVPFWLALVILCIAYAAIATPLGYLRRSSYAMASGQRYHGSGADGFATFFVVVIVGLLAYELVPEFQIWIDSLRASFGMLALQFV